MRTTATWAFFRRAQYILFFTMITSLLVTGVYYSYFYVAPTCFDNTQDNNESGVDCGGVCTRICTFEVNVPQVLWARSFNITDGQYNAVAYIENTNTIAATPEISYTFSLYDAEGLIIERSGTTLLPPDSVYPIFEGRIFTGGRVPTRTLLDIEAPELWQPAKTGRDQFTIIDRTLTGADSKPRLYAVVKNNSLEEAREVEVVATIFDAYGTALTSSRTFVDNFSPRTDTEVVFTWLEPIATTLRSCEIPTDVLVAVDLSGSMNDDGGDPPEPVTSVKDAASSFVSRLGEDDQVGVVTFATEASLVLPLSNNKESAASLVRGLEIAKLEEVGSTNTGDALRVGGLELQSERHNDSARKVIVLLTDGLATAPNEDPEGLALLTADRVKEAGIEVYTIGLGEKVNMEFVQSLATTPEYAYQALTRTDVENIYNTITASLCEEGAAMIDVIPKTGASFEPL